MLIHKGYISNEVRILRRYRLVLLTEILKVEVDWCWLILEWDSYYGCNIVRQHVEKRHNLISQLLFPVTINRVEILS